RSLMVIFFFQAEDGIRDRNVTGVQTCALPISTTTASGSPAGALSEFCVLSCSLIASSSCRSGLLLTPTLEHKRSEHLPYVTSLSESGQSPDNTRAHLGRCPPTDPRRCLLRQAAYEYSRNGRHFSTGLSIPRIHSCPSRGS